MSQTPTPEQPAAKGPGTCLMIILEMLNIHPNTCECRERARQMDEWGISGTKQHRDEIIQWLRTEQYKRGWVKYLQAAAKALQTGIYKSINPIDPAPGLVNLAISMAEETERLAAENN